MLNSVRNDNDDDGKWQDEEERMNIDVFMDRSISNAINYFYPQTNNNFLIVF